MCCMGLLLCCCCCLGANTGGKSTLLRAACLAVIMAQVGCHAPAAALRLAPVDAIFTRVGRWHLEARTHGCSPTVALPLVHIPIAHQATCIPVLT
jgi:hypothetical protein